MLQRLSNIDPSNYRSAPSLAWDALLLMTGIEFDLITDHEVLDMIEKQKKAAYASLVLGGMLKLITITWMIMTIHNQKLILCIGMPTIYIGCYDGTIAIQRLTI